MDKNAGENDQKPNKDNGKKAAEKADKKGQDTAKSTSSDCGACECTAQKKFFVPVMILGFLAILLVAIMPTLGEIGMASESATTTIGKWIGFLGLFCVITWWILFKFVNDI